MFPAAAAKSLQSCPTLCDPIDGSPPGSPVPGILQARTLEWGATAFSVKCSLGISNFLQVISSLSHSIVFLYFFILIIEERFLISLCYSLDSAFRWVYLSFSSFPLACLLYSAICKASSDNHFAFFAFLFLGRDFAQEGWACT